MNKLELPKNKRIRGLYIFCNCCNKKFSKPHSCEGSADRQVYKAILTIPGTTKVKTKILDTRNFDEAIRLTLEFENDLKRNNFQLPKETNDDEVKPRDLVGCIAMYIDYLANENVPDHKKRIRTGAHIKQTSAYLKRFVVVLEDSGININGFLIENVTDKHVGIFYKHLIDKNYANRTYNRHMDCLSELYKYLINRKQYKLVNLFDPQNTQRKRVNPQIDSVDLDDFKRLLNILKPENGIQYLDKGVRKHLYFEWLKDAFELGLYTGRRRDEIVNMKFSDIYERNGKPYYIKTEDHKYNKKNDLVKEEEIKYNYTPVIPELSHFLIKIGYQKYKGTNRYLLAPDVTMTRTTLKDKMSKAFSHYYLQLGLDRNLNFRHLRKTYITAVNHFTRGKAEIITGQSGQQIIKKSYEDQKVFDNVYTDFRIMS